MAKAMQVIFVDRKAKDSKQATIDEVIRRIEYAKNNTGIDFFSLLIATNLSLKGKKTFPQILIFPEGTTTNGSSLISFKRGAVWFQYFCYSYSLVSARRPCTTSCSLLSTSPQN
jgi:1-acyl-sn-glycerol-3-phosphate acyltransferase